MPLRIAYMAPSHNLYNLYHFYIKYKQRYYILPILYYLMKLIKTIMRYKMTKERIKLIMEDFGYSRSEAKQYIHEVE